MRASTWPASPPCTGSCAPRTRSASAAPRPPRARPELTADGPSQIWSWDITKLKGPIRGVWFDLFVMLDIFSRKAIRWEVHATENAELAKAFIDAAVAGNGGIAPVSDVRKLLRA